MKPEQLASIPRPEIAPATPEQTETVAPTENDRAEVIEEIRRQQTAVKTAKKPAVMPTVRSAAVVAVESVLADGLTDAYARMSRPQQQAFKTSGEIAAGKISVLLQASKVKVNKIVDLIKRWLQQIPGVSRFFIEQEAKIKTDRLLALKRQPPADVR